MKFIKGDDTKERKNAPRGISHPSSDEESDGEDKKKEEPQVRTRYDRMFERRNQDVLADHYSKLINDDGTRVADGTKSAADDADEDDFLSVKRRFDAGDKDLDMGSDSDDGTEQKDTKVVHIDGSEPLVIDSKRREKLLKSKKKLLKYKGTGTKLVYDEEGNSHEIYELEDEEDFRARGDAKEQQAKFLAEEGERTRMADVEDKEVAKQKRREKKEKRKARERELDEQEDYVAQLPPDADDVSTPAESDEEEPRPSKKPKVSFVEPEEKSKKGDRQAKPAAEPKQIGTLEQLEDLASGLLG